MNHEFKRFQKEHYAEYASWFTDPELHRQLGPMDHAWLDAVLAEPEATGATWAVFRGAELIAVVETILDPAHLRPAVISAIAVKPVLRRQGIGTAVLRTVLSLNRTKGATEHAAHIQVNNQAAQRCMEGLGFVAIASTPNEDGYVEFRYRPSATDTY